MSKNAQSRGLARSLLASVLLGGLVTVAGLPTAAQAVPQPFLGEVVCGGWTFCPAGWTECDGKMLDISQNNDLFNLIGTTYGGDGQNTFAVPNIQSRTMVGQGQGIGLNDKALGQTGGAETVTLLNTQMPGHTHPMAAHDGADRAATPSGKIPGTSPAGAPVYGAGAPNTALKPTAVGIAGGSQPHNNLQPYLAVKCCISLTGVFPMPQ
jgi:microcystin-dependent protein